MRTIAAILGLLTLSIMAPSPPSLCAGCATASAQGSPYSNRTWVVVGYSSGLAPYSSSISAGMNMWNSGCNGASTCTYPGFGFYSAGATYESTLSIVYQSGLAPSANCAGGTQYCRATWNATTRTMTVYEYAGNPNNNLTHISQLSSDQLSRVFAHEFGHALGLGDGFCGGIMDQAVSPTASIAADECSMADSQNHVPWEGTSNEGCLSLADCRMSPVVIDLEHDGYELSGIEDPVMFDIDGDGALDRMAWTARGSDDAFLFQDFNGNGIADDGTELFGTAMAANGFEALRRGDMVDQGDLVAGGDGNNVLDARDQLWSHLRLWVDADHDGLCQVDEVFTLEEKGVLSIDLLYRWAGKKDRHDNEFRYRAAVSIRNRHGQPMGGNVYDIFFVVDPR